MRKPAELIDMNYWTGGKEFKSRSSNLKRLAGGIRSQIDGAHHFGLTAKELKILENAQSLLASMSSTLLQASKLKDRIRADREAKRKEARAAVGKTFGQLASTPDQIALISMINRYMIVEIAKPSILQLQFLQQQFEDALDSIAFDIANKDAPVDSAVKEAWQRYSERKSDAWQKAIEKYPSLSNLG
jgi:hypothetical protein